MSIVTIILLFVVGGIVYDTAHSSKHEDLDKTSLQVMYDEIDSQKIEIENINKTVRQLENSISNLQRILASFPPTE